MLDTFAPPAVEPTRSDRLLPAILTRPASYAWFWTLPVAVLLLLNLRGYSIVEGDMSDDERTRAMAFGVAGLANVLLSLAIFIVARRGRVGAWVVDTARTAWALPAVAVQVSYLWLALAWVDQMLPATVTVWIYTPDRFIFNQLTFAMVPLAIGVLRLACGRPPRTTGCALAISLGTAIGAPVLLYLAMAALSSSRGSGRLVGLIYAVLFVGLGLAMFFGIVRALMLLLRMARRWGSTGERIAIGLIALAMPVAGLLLNRHIPFPVDLQGWEVYTLVAVNAIVLITASWKARAWPRAGFLLLCGSFPFTLYFFVVFLPYTPLSILAVLALGLGFLVLAPTFLFTLHLHLLHKAWAAQAPDNRGVPLVSAGVACTLLLPGFFAVRALADRAALHAALDHVTEPIVTASEINYAGSRAGLRRAIHNHRDFKHGIYYPILSDTYGWIVFDSLVLPDDTLDQLEFIFFGDIRPRRRSQSSVGFTDIFGTTGRVRTRMPRASSPPQTAAVRDLALVTEPGSHDTGTATLKLTLENTGAPTSGPAEYVQELPLPAGAMVSGFRLHINGTPVPGRIFERKTALWVYSMIRDSERRDPGLLLYAAPESLELRVFPINSGQPATVEVDFLFHGTGIPAEPEGLAAGTLDPALALESLWRHLTPAIVAGPDGSVIASGLHRLGIPRATRPPFLHVIVDRSMGNGFDGELAPALRVIRETWPEAQTMRVTLANYAVRDLTAQRRPVHDHAGMDARSLEATLPREGGLSLDLALARTLRQHHDEDLSPQIGQTGNIPERPVIVILQRMADSRLPELEIMRHWLDLAPDVEIHSMSADGSSVALHKPDSAAVAIARVGDSVRCIAPDRPTRFRPTQPAAALELWSPADKTWLPIPDLPAANPSTPWARAMFLQARQQDHDRSPGDAAHPLRSLVAASRESGILLASTSYIVVENQAQWRMLALSEQRKLGQPGALEFLETPAPPAAVVIIVFGLWILLRRRGTSRRHARPGLPAF